MRVGIHNNINLMLLRKGLHRLSAMVVRVNLNEIQLKDLNNDCLLLATKFVRTLKAYNGKVLRLQDKDILMKIAKRSRATKNQELKDIYAELKEEIKKSLYESM